MRSGGLLGLLASSLFVGSQASVTKRQGFSCDDVDVRKLRDPEESKKIWDGSGAGVVGENYIADNGLDNWVQNLDQDIFDSDVSDSWDCHEWDSQCHLEKECRKCFGSPAPRPSQTWNRAE